MSSGGPFLENLKLLRKHLWGKEVINVVQEGEKSYAIIDLTLFNLPQNLSPDNVLLIREEYILTYHAILDTIQQTPGPLGSAFLVTGQPGIGKTLFLMYLLVRRLQERQPVALQMNSNTFALFDEHGVSLHISSNLDSAFLIPKDAWALSDSGEGDGSPCSAFKQRCHGPHIVHTSLPASNRWERWTDHLSARKYVMDVWSLDEFRTLLTISNLDVQRGVTLFEKYGPSPRILIDLLMFPGREAAYLRGVNTAADDLSREFSKNFCSLRSLDFSSNIFAEILMVRPDTPQLRLPSLYIPTPFLASTLGVAISRHSAAQKYTFFMLLDSYPPLRDTAGWLFENYAYICFAGPNNISFQEYPGGKPNLYQIPTTNVVITGSTALKTIQPPFSFYWRPQEPYFNGVHALIRSNNVVWVLQFVISRPCGSVTKGLDKVFEVMNYKTDVEWNLVIVSPDKRAAVEFSQNHQILTGQWERIRVYVCELPLDTFTEDNVQRLRANLNETNGMYPS